MIRTFDINETKLMYKYPNGLQCDASMMRIQSFEALVPPLFTGLLIVGLIAIFTSAFEYTSPLNAIALAGVVSCAYCVVVGLIACVVFKFWCKPIDLQKT